MMIHTTHYKSDWSFEQLGNDEVAAERWFSIFLTKIRECEWWNQDWERTLVTNNGLDDDLFPLIVWGDFPKEWKHDLRKAQDAADEGLWDGVLCTKQ